MKIAIITWFGGYNSGTFFQLYGLYSYLSDRGHEVKVINYRNASKDYLPKGMYYYFSQFRAGLLKKLKSKKENKKMALIQTQYADDFKLRQKRFDEFYGKLTFTDPVITDADFDTLNNKFDAFVVGSDQVWNATCLNRRFFLDFVHKDKIKVAYAPSIGTGYVFSQAERNYQKYLSEFTYISTREKRLVDILNGLLPFRIQHVLDPSMLIDRDEYEKIVDYPLTISPHKYVLCYFMPINDEERKKVFEYAEEHSLKVVIMTMFSYSYSVKGAEIYACAGPAQFLGLIKNAAVVMTSSFHCTLFSLLFNKELFVFEHRLTGKSADVSLRYKELLESFGLPHRLILSNENIEGEHLLPIDYSHVNEVFACRLSESKAFLNQFC